MLPWRVFRSMLLVCDSILGKTKNSNVEQKREIWFQSLGKNIALLTEHGQVQYEMTFKRHGRQYGHFQEEIRHSTFFSYKCRGGSRIFGRRGCTSKEWRHYPGFFLRGGAPLRNDVTGRWGKQILKANTKKKAHLRGGGRGGRTPCTHPLDPPRPEVALMVLMWKPTLFKGSLTGARDDNILIGVSV